MRPPGRGSRSWTRSRPPCRAASRTRGRIGVAGRQLACQSGHFGCPGPFGALFADHFVVGVVVARVGGGDGAEAGEEGEAQAGGDGLAVGGEEAGEDVLALGAVEADGGLPGEVVEADVVRVDAGGDGAEQCGGLALEADGHVAQAGRPAAGLEEGAGDDADRVGEVGDPGVGVGASAVFGDVQPDGGRAQGLGRSSGAGGLLAGAAAFQGPGLVLGAGRPVAGLEEGGGPRRRRRARCPGRGRW